MDLIDHKQAAGKTGHSHMSVRLLEAGQKGLVDRANGNWAGGVPLGGFRGPSSDLAAPLGAEALCAHSMLIAHFDVSRDCLDDRRWTRKGVLDIAVNSAV
jgi:hypothetical protein